MTPFLGTVALDLGSPEVERRTSMPIPHGSPESPALSATGPLNKTLPTSAFPPWNSRRKLVVGRLCHLALWMCIPGDVPWNIVWGEKKRFWIQETRETLNLTYQSL